MSTQSMVFGPDQDGESVVVYVEDGSVQNVVLRDSDDQQIPYAELTKEHWTTMSEAEDRAVEQLERESAATTATEEAEEATAAAAVSTAARF